MRDRAYEEVLRHLARARVAMAILAGLVTVYTLALEAGFPFLVRTRPRPLLVARSARLHVGSRSR